MTISRRALCTLYVLIGITALVMTWGNVLDLLQGQGFVQGTLAFWRDVLVNGSSRFITLDMLFLSLSVTVWMVLESRRLAIPGVWLYVAFGALIGISCAVPMFLVHRERRLAAGDSASAAGTLHTADVLGIALLAVVILAYGIEALAR